ALNGDVVIQTNETEFITPKNTRREDYDVTTANQFTRNESVYETTSMYPTAKKTGECPDGWARFENKCYMKGDRLTSFSDRLKECISLGASILTINSKEENQFITDTFPETQWIGVMRLTGADVFIRFEPTGHLSYLMYTQWRIGEPNNLFAKENCVELNRGFWNDVPCDYHLSGICQKYVS
ncbi:ladderlectin-like protein, partial [Leptotrombidium deliense]